VCPDNPVKGLWPTITRLQPITPKPQRSEPIEILERDEGRALICEACDENKGVTRWAGQFRLYIVKCNQCGCSGKSLRDSCPLKKW
jgi:hypothetical protein